MKYPLSKQIYECIEAFRGDDKVLGSYHTLRQMKEGNLNPTLKILARILKDNGMPAEIVIHVKKENKTGKTKIKL